VRVCDGCGVSVDDDHIRQRIQRLEMATRFRPIHINLLLIDSAPPSDPRHFFYAAYAAATGDAPGSEPSAYFQELAKLAAPAAPGKDLPPESVLAEFQRRGFFVTSAVECPMPNPDDLSVAIRRLAATVLRRVQSSYKPKYVALISEPTAGLIEPLRAAGWADRLILDKGMPFGCPADRQQAHVEPAESFGARLAAATSHLA